MFRTLDLRFDTDITNLETHHLIEGGIENDAPIFLFGVFDGGLFDSNYGNVTYKIKWGGAGAWIIENAGTAEYAGTCLLEDQSPNQLPYSVYEDWLFSDTLPFRFSDFEVIENNAGVCGFEMYVQKKDEAPVLVDIKAVTSFQYGSVFVFEFAGVISNEMFVIFIDIGNTTYSLIEFTSGPLYYRHAVTDLGQEFLPIDTEWDLFPIPGDELTFFESVTSSLVACPTYFEDRTKRTFSTFKLPQSFTEENRGGDECCCKHLVLGGGSETWQKDTTSMWFKRAEMGDVVTFQAFHNGVDISEFLPAPTQFPNDLKALYVTVDWTSILAEYGVGCVELGIGYTIAGLSGTIPWGEYDLKPFSVENAMGTARIRAIFNSYHEADGIDFTGSNVESCIRFQGFVGHRQPNTETDNIIYSDRQMKRVIRENLNTYEILTDPLNECIIRPMVDVFLLSENELFISDYNYHNHSYRFNDIPVIVEQSPVIDYFDWSRKAKLTAVVGDKFKNQRTYFK